MIKSEINVNENSVVIDSGTKALLCCNFNKNGKVLLNDLKKVDDIPVIIDSSLEGDKYKIKVYYNIKGLKINTIY